MEDIEKNVRIMDGNDDSIILRSNKMDMVLLTDTPSGRFGTIFLTCRQYLWQMYCQDQKVRIGRSNIYQLLKATRKKTKRFFPNCWNLWFGRWRKIPNRIF